MDAIREEGVGRVEAVFDGALPSLFVLAALVGRVGCAASSRALTASNAASSIAASSSLLALSCCNLQSEDQKLQG